MSEPDEFGRVPGVDYTGQTWTVAGYTVTTEEQARLLSSYITKCEDNRQPVVPGQEPPELMQIIEGT